APAAAARATARPRTSRLRPVTGAVGAARRVTPGRLPRTVQSHASDDLFERAWQRDPSLVPLAERMRPRRLEDVVGQAHLLGPGKILRRIADTGRVPSLILWGPPGTGKTTLARLLAEHTQSAFCVLSATSAGAKDLREVVEVARRRRAHEGRGTLLFVDE